MPNLAFLVVLFVVFRVVLRVVRLLFDALEKETLRLSGFEPDWSIPTYKIVRVALIAFAVVIAYPYLPGAQSDAFKGVSLFVGVLISLGSSSAIANLIAGYLLIYRRAFKIGDRVKIGDVIGDVTESKIQVTRLRSLKNEEVVIPNSQILGGEVTNYSAIARREGLILHTEVGIGYETPWRQVEAMLLTAAERTPDILRTPAPFVLQRALANFAVTYELNVYCDKPGRMLEVYSDLHRQILDVFNEYGIQIMTPAYMADPPEPKIVPAAQWYPHRPIRRTGRIRRRTGTRIRTRTRIRVRRGPSPFILNPTFRSHSESAEYPRCRHRIAFGHNLFFRQGFPATCRHVERVAPVLLFAWRESRTRGARASRSPCAESRQASRRLPLTVRSSVVVISWCALMALAGQAWAQAASSGTPPDQAQGSAPAAQPQQRAAVSITCASKVGERQDCPADTSSGVVLARSYGDVGVPARQDVGLRRQGCVGLRRMHR